MQERKEHHPWVLLCHSGLTIISQHGNNKHFIQPYFSIASFMGTIATRGGLTPILLMSKLSFQEAERLDYNHTQCFRADLEPKPSATTLPLEFKLPSQRKCSLNLPFSSALLSREPSPHQPTALPAFKTAFMLAPRTFSHGV